MRGKKLVDDVMSHLILTLIGLFSQILTAPLYIRDFGQQGYSRLSIILSVCAFVMVSDYGIYLTASSRLVYVYRNHNYFSRSIWQQYARSIAIAFAVTTLILLLYFLHLTKTNPSLWKNFEFAWAILILFMGSAAMNLVQNALLIKFQVTDKFGRGMKVLACLRLMETAIQAMSLYFKMEFVSFAIVTSICKVISTVIFWVLANRSLGISASNSIIADDDQDSSLIKGSAGKAVFNFTNLLGLHGTMLIASLWITPQLLFPILIARMITSPVRYLSDSLIHGGLPRLTVHFRKLSESTLKEKRSSSRFNIALAVSGSFALICTTTLITGPFLWRYFSFGNSEYPQTLILVFLCSTYLDSIAAVIAMLGIARNQANAIQYAYLSSVVLALGVQYCFRNVWGWYSVPISLAIGDLIFVLFTVGGLARNRAAK